MDDCGDNSDESSTDGPLCANTNQCPSGMFKCKKSGKCIYNSYKCDGEVDCGDGDDSDEKESCDTLTCKPDEFKCNDYRCIEKSWVCDGADDCGDNSDEKNCKTTAAPTTLSTTSTKPKHSASPGELRSAINCEEFSFLCPNDNRCIHDKWVCDGMRDCSDGHDEREDYCSKKCNPTDFKCPDGTCVLASHKCDGIKQCPNGEDELLPQCNVFVNCTAETHKCKGTDRCIAQTHVCDKVKNCPEDDDETENCAINECETNNGGCSHHCIDTKLGHNCSCPLGYKLGADFKTCEDINECLMAGVCSQFCINYNGYHECECDEGFELESDKKTCKAKGPLPYLLFSNKHDIREISTNFHDYRLVVEHTKNPVTIDADISSSMIYWADHDEKTINRASKDKSKPKEVLVRDVSALSLKLDWIGQKLYWIDSVNNKITVSNLDGTHSKTFLEIAKTNKLESIALMPEQGLLYLSTSSGPVESVDMQSKVRKVISNDPAKFLTVDTISKRLYWVNEQSSHIESVNLEGQEKHIVVKLNHTSVNGLAIFEDYIYYSSHEQKKLYKVNKFTGKYEGKMEQSENPMDIVVYHPVAQKQVLHPCQQSNGGCSHLCFVASIKLATYFCDCPDTMKLYSDQKTCIPQDLVSNCTADEYTCKVTKQCIPLKLVCNGRKNCAFNDDELNCGQALKKDVKTGESNKSSNSNLYMYIGAGVGGVVLLIVIIVVFMQFRKKSREQEKVTMVFKQDGDDNGKDYSEKCNVEIKYVPSPQKNTTKNNSTPKSAKSDRSNKNFANQNFIDTSSHGGSHQAFTVEVDGMDCELMIDENDSSDSNSLDESQPIMA